MQNGTKYLIVNDLFAVWWKAWHRTLVIKESKNPSNEKPKVKKHFELMSIESKGPSSQWETESKEHCQQTKQCETKIKK